MRKQKPSSPAHKPTGENAEIVVANLKKIIDQFKTQGMQTVNWQFVGNQFEFTRGYKMNRENTRQLKNINHAVTLISLIAMFMGIDIDYLWKPLSDAEVAEKVELWIESGVDIEAKFKEFIQKMKGNE